MPYFINDDPFFTISATTTDLTFSQHESLSKCSWSLNGFFFILVNISHHLPQSQYIIQYITQVEKHMHDRASPHLKRTSYSSFWLKFDDKQKAQNNFAIWSMGSVEFQLYGFIQTLVVISRQERRLNLFGINSLLFIQSLVFNLVSVWPRSQQCFSTRKIQIGPNKPNWKAKNHF